MIARTVDTRCENGHELRADVDGRGVVLAVGVRDDEMRAWVFEGGAFCPTCGADLVMGGGIRGRHSA